MDHGFLIMVFKSIIIDCREFSIQYWSYFNTNNKQVSCYDFGDRSLHNYFFNGTIFNRVYLYNRILVFNYTQLLNIEHHTYITVVKAFRVSEFIKLKRYQIVFFCSLSSGITFRISSFIIIEYGVVVLESLLSFRWT